MLKKPVLNEQAFLFYESHAKQQYPITNKTAIRTIAPTLLEINNINNIPIAIKNAINPIACLVDFCIGKTYFVELLFILYAFIKRL